MNARAAAASDDEAAALRQQLMGFRLTQMLHVAARLGLADRLVDGPRTAADLADVVGAHPTALARLMRALAGVGVLRQIEGGACARNRQPPCGALRSVSAAEPSFALTPRGRWLCAGTPGSLRDLALLYGDEWLWRAYGGMLQAVRSGEAAFDRVHGQPLYDWLATHPDEAEVFDRAMSGYSAGEAQAIGAAYDFSRVRRLVDVGGGQGALALALLRRWPRLHTTVFDLPGAIDGARRAVAEAGLQARCDCVAGDFFVDLPPAGDLLLLKSVLHNWNDERAGAILRHCRRALPAGGRLLIAERVVATQDARSAEAELFDINMLVVTGGQERSPMQYRALLALCGFGLLRVIQTDSALSLIEARPEPH